MRIVWILAAASVAWAQKIGFDSAGPGTIPAGWSIAMTHSGYAPRWEVAIDPSAPSKPNVFAQVSTDKTSSRFPLAIHDRIILTNGSLSVRFKTISGESDQAAGLVWRYRDADNYYIVRANALEGNVVLYKVEGGKRIPLEPKGAPPKTYGVKRDVPKQTWCELKVSFSGPKFKVYFNRVKIMEVEDRTFAAAGPTGLWTKADSVTYFDDFRIGRKN